ncbi:hypothetical protein C8R43DRAFT_944920 [Mycena crocata]|nr:hypothetical protein C8R43DRAFT_944920 [Mycena crocata]
MNMGDDWQKRPPLRGIISPEEADGVAFGVMDGRRRRQQRVLTVLQEAMSASALLRISEHTRVVASQYLLLLLKECLPDSKAPIPAVLLGKHNAAKASKTSLKPDASLARGQTVNTVRGRLEAGTYEAGFKHDSYPFTFIWVRMKCIYHGSERRKIEKGLRQPD